MALLEELDSAPGADQFPEMYDKINALISTVNAILGGGAAGQGVRKIDATDFNFEFYKLNVKSYSVDDNSNHAITPTYETAVMTITESGKNHITISGAVVGANISARIKMEILRAGVVKKTVKFITDNEADTVNDATVFSYTFMDEGAGDYTVKFTNELAGTTTATLQTYTLTAISIIS